MQCSGLEVHWRGLGDAKGRTDFAWQRSGVALQRTDGTLHRTRVTLQMTGGALERTCCARDLAPLLTQLVAQHTHSALKLDPPTYNGRTDFREWKPKLELIYDAKQLSDAHKLTWTIALLQEGVSRVALKPPPPPTPS